VLVLGPGRFRRLVVVDLCRLAGMAMTTAPISLLAATNRAAVLVVTVTLPCGVPAALHDSCDDGGVDVR
jgi:hypothetical protein